MAQTFDTSVQFGEGPPENESGQFVPALFFDAESGMFYFRVGGGDWQAVEDPSEAKAKADAIAEAKAEAEEDAADALEASKAAQAAEAEAEAEAN